MARAPRRRLLLALVVGLAACDFGATGGGGGGCARIHQGDYQLPVKRIVRESVAVRLTQRGVDFVTARVRSLVLAFFEADPVTGRAVIPLSSLGVGSLSTGLGPFDAAVRDLVLTVDLSALEVRFVPGSSPPRLQIRLDDAVVGVQSGVLSGVVDTLVFDGDAACALSDGPSGYLARLDLVLELELATAADGGVDVRVLPIDTLDLYDVGLSVAVDCALDECLDGLTPPATGECLECEAICPALELAGALASLIRGAFDSLVDELLALLADDLANLFLDGFLNGRPLAVEGTLDLAGLFGPVLRWMASARPLGLLARPAGDAFRLTGAGGALGLELVLDAGADVDTAHPCVGDPGAEPVFEAGPRPYFDGVVALPDGAPGTYDLAVAVSGALVNEAVWALFESGALCVSVTTDDLATLSGGGLVVTARALELLLPGISSVAGPRAPARLRLEPAMGGAAPAPVHFGDGVATPLIGIALDGARVSVDVAVGEQLVTVVSFEAAVTLALAADVRPDASIALRLDGVEVHGLRLPVNELFAEARLDVIAPVVVELALGALAARPITVDLGLDGLTRGLGVPVAPAVVAVQPAGVGADWLAIYVALTEPPPVNALVVPPASLVEARPGALVVDAAPAPGEAVALRVAGGSWSAPLTEAGRHVVPSSRLWLAGRWPVEARLRDGSGAWGPAWFVGWAEVSAP